MQTTFPSLFIINENYTIFDLRFFKTFFLNSIFKLNQKKKKGKNLQKK